MNDDPQRDPWRELNLAAQTVREVGEKVDRDREANERLAKLNEERIAASIRKMRWYRRAGVTGAVLAPLALWAGLTARHAVNELRTQRDQGRIVACQKDNEYAVKTNKLGMSMGTIVDLATPPNPNRSPAQQAQVDRFVGDSKQALAEARIALRDCSPAAVAAFYRQGR